jgi:tetratricopeptide (TPR) repeat protein
MFSSPSDLAKRVLELQHSGTPEEALTVTTQWVQDEPHSSDAWAAHARTLDAQDKPADAMAALDRAIAIHPDHVVALLHRGQLLYQLKQFEASLATFSKAKERAQLFIPAYVPSLTLAEAQLHFEFGHLSQAAELLSECSDVTRMWLDRPIDALFLKNQLQAA